MKVILLFVSMMVLLMGGAGVGYLVARRELRGRARRELERDGWTREHQKIYHQAVGVLDRILRAHDLDAPMEFRTVLLPDNLRTSAQITVNRYRKEIDA